MLLFIDFNILWRYFAWINQSLAVFTLWAAAVYLVQRNANHWICTIPAIFMTFLIQSYILVADEGFRLNYNLGLSIAALFTVGCILLFAKKCMVLRQGLTQRPVA
jgi:carbon starvation protein CstA